MFGKALPRCDVSSPLLWAFRSTTSLLRIEVARRFLLRVCGGGQGAGHQQGDALLSQVSDHMNSFEKNRLYG